ncbi:MAG: DNA internalization-related competence protein ComEC/Rec2 [Candidatus Thioglobus sp.]|nr:MAG: DNA internalization-related competence protein ComEC/Rec2 [Candidatus Thioglobus sp.]
MEWAAIFAIILLIFASFKHLKTIATSLLFLLCGFAWMGLISTQIFNAKVDDIFLNKPILVQGEIVELPEKTTNKAKFIFQAKSPFKGRLKLSWYQNDDDNEDFTPDLQSGDSWQLLLKIKRNNGFQNLSGFDYEKWLFYKRINASGYVRLSPLNHRIDSAKTLSVDRIRQNIRQSLLPIFDKQEFGGVLNALIIGDRSLITNEHWELFMSTNTTHLSVISGLHIGLISGFIFLLSSFLWRRSVRLSLIIPAQISGAFFGLISAFLYASIAGFSIPTNRAFIMASVVFLAIIFRCNFNTWKLYGLALFLVLINNPLSVLSAGFWLSFYVVAVIIYGVGQHQKKHWMYRLIYIQLLISIATLPLLVWFFSGISLTSPLANIVAIPVFSFATIPLALIGALLSLIGLPYLAQIVLEIANQTLIYLALILQQLQQLELNRWHYAQTSLIDLALFILAIFIAISPRELRLRWLSIPILGLMMFATTHKITDNSLLLTTFDVGQGLSHIVQTKNHILLFDTGAKYPSGFNLGDSVINPYLQAKHIRRIDKIIISHGDNDHIGGLDSVLQNFKADEILSSVPGRINARAKNCQAGQNWEWDGVLFEILSPEKGGSFKNNNASCVLKISNGDFSALLTGDIEKETERWLLQNFKEKLKSTILVAPHHGSKTSSTQEFLTAVAPKIVVISSGFKNRFNHPAKTIVERYQANNIKILQTNCSGQIDIMLADEVKILKYREEFRRYYFRQCE